MLARLAVLADDRSADDRHSAWRRPLKGVILAGGTGSRLHPLTQITNKHLLPIGDRPMVAYAIEALVTSGISQIMLVTGGTHAGEFLRLLGNGHDWGLDVLTYAYQERPGGIGEALGLTERFVGDDRVVVMLADNLFERSIEPFVAKYSAQPEGARVLLAELREPSHLKALGVPAMENGRIVDIVEKPDVPPSSYAVTGVYMYEPSVFSVIPTLERSARGELEISDVNNYFVHNGLLDYDVIDGFWGDAGESIDKYYEVNDHIRETGANLRA
jgi:glucose-1-phosphate thymidylyltransferase